MPVILHTTSAAAAFTKLPLGPQIEIAPPPPPVLDLGDIPPRVEAAATTTTHEDRLKFLIPALRAHFEEVGEELVREDLRIYEEPKRLAAVAWLKEKRDARAEEEMRRYKALLRWTRWAAIAAAGAVLVGLLTLAMSLMPMASGSSL